MLRMIDRHAVQQMLTAGVRIGEVARHFEVSRRTIERIRKEPAVEGAEDAVARWKRGVGRPPVPATVRERMRTLIAEDPEAPPLAEHEGAPIPPPSSMMPRGKAAAHSKVQSRSTGKRNVRPLFTQVPRTGILGTSPLGFSKVRAIAFACTGILAFVSNPFG
jgi:hypothetical protein